MDNAYVIALIAAMLQVRNQVALIGLEGSDRDTVVANLGDPIIEARELLETVVNDAPELPEAPNTKGGGTNG
jgi:hypothetical protein